VAPVGSTQPLPHLAQHSLGHKRPQQSFKHTTQIGIQERMQMYIWYDRAM
jgi:hypothetical protein